MTRTTAPEVAAPSLPADPRRRRYFGGVLGGLRPGFVTGLLVVGAAVLGLVVQGSAVSYVAASVLWTESGARAACAVGVGDAIGYWCDMVRADLPEIPEQHPVTPDDVEQICSHFVRQGDPQDRARTRRPCSFAFRDAPAAGSVEKGEMRAGFLSFSAPASRPQDLDSFAANLQLWAEYDAEYDDDFGIGKVIARPRDDVLVYTFGGPLDGDQSFTVACGTFDLEGSLNTHVDVTAVALALADHWCPATEQPAPGGLED